MLDRLRRLFAPDSAARATEKNAARRLLEGSRVAVCYWGLTRSTRFHYQTHRRQLKQRLLDAGAEVSVYVHVWFPSGNECSGGDARRRSKREAYLLEPDVLIMESQEPFLRGIVFGDYFRDDLYEKHGDSEFEWHPHFVRNHLCALESLRRVYALASSSELKHDFVIFVRPDMEILSSFPVDQLAASGPKDILICDNNHGDGYNDRFAAMRFEAGLFYARRLEGLRDYRRNVGRIVSEKYLRHVIDSCFSAPTFICFHMRRVRHDGRKLAN